MSFTIHEEVRREVARCVSENLILRIAPAAARITAGHLANEAGISAAVPIEIEMPEPAGRGGILG